jgi:two-component system nitrate/nitrite response regulator NarL
MTAIRNVEWPERAADPEARRQTYHRLMVVDDHELYRTGLRTLLVREGYKVAEAPSGEAALRVARSFRPDLVVMDMNMPGTSGIDATRMLLTEHPRLSVLMLTVTADDDGVLDALRAGASGYLLKDAEMSEIVAGIESAAAGHSAISPRVASALVRTVRSAPARPGPLTSVQALSPRERTVLALVAQGYENAQIAQRIFISPSTARNLVSRVLEKLGVDNRVQAATFAVRHGLVDLANDS